ncbi:predicted transporter component [Acetobacter aceti NRIC 0242]|uniref:Membrane protein n=1 Tax=Acetobacter aceti NBRC 14818 TaxID=887700 RepID=A0AB33IE14_ACEAC|nr:YeeE/YedE family protein [Acetobacter aceti]TCS33013.1 hypothetical protein EDC15_10983 [Acetobacter aceti NBRC 14818]BCK76440.1 membrane protein [Acetobacter aceti NBRC 14818]GAN56182.1 hypothetical protein Abac_003_081 [Acetobacter aceti NBRC 14818]GBO81909.1 predicted transporter component [Acetobacter aceti NRIC 0242]
MIFYLAATFASALLFGLGLCFSGMLDPQRVQGFLDVTGQWDPSLCFVLMGATGLAALAVLLQRKMKKPVLDVSFHMPTARHIDRNLVIGSALFGVGWGLSGICPAPALTAIIPGHVSSYLFLFGLIVGISVYEIRARRQ